MHARLATLCPCLALLAAFAAAGQAVAANAAGDCANADTRSSQTSLKKERAAIVCLLNIERAQRGLVSLGRSRKLTRAASSHSREMVRHSYFDHQDPGGSTPVDRIRRAGYIAGHASWAIGENLAWGAGPRSAPRAIVRSWMLSGEHRGNVLDRGFKQIGIGAVRGTPEPGASYTAGNGLSDSVVVTADFGAH